MFRVPRRRSDTQQKGSACWEFAHTVDASMQGVAPTLHTSWYSRHAENRWPSGLYMVMEYYPYDLEHVMKKRGMREFAQKNRQRIGEQLVKHIQCLADKRMFVYDLKPSNIVLRSNGDEIDVRIIDFGRDFCEWDNTSASQQVDQKSPTINMINKILARDRQGSQDVLLKHILFACMLVQLSATTTCFLYEHRSENNMSSDVRLSVNPTHDFCSTLLTSMQGRNISVLREVMRTDDVKGVLRHYHGRRNAGTRKTLDYACACEC